jgi:alkylation response protein AidB-like acyl-CoA dehydrogenase
MPFSRRQLTAVNARLLSSAVDVQLTDEQQFLREAVAGAVGRNASLIAVRDWAERDDLSPADVLSAEQGWTGIGLKEELGGQGGGVLELAVVAEQLGRGAVPWDRTLAGCLATPLIAATGTVGSELAERTAAGSDSAVLCVDGRRPPHVAGPDVLCDDRITARARYVLGADRAAHLIVPIASDGRVELFDVDASAPGVSVRRRRIVDRTRALADVELSEVPARHLGSASPEAFAATAAAAAVLLAADALGAASTLLELTIAYVQERRQFGVAVGSFQAVKHSAAEMLVKVEASRSAVYYAAWAVDAQSESSDCYASIAKAYAGANAVAVADRALFLHGAIGYTWEHDLQFCFKRASSDELLFGSSETHLDRIAELLALGKPADEYSTNPVG